MQPIFTQTAYSITKSLFFYLIRKDWLHSPDIPQIPHSPTYLGQSVPGLRAKRLEADIANCLPSASIEILERKVPTAYSIKEATMAFDAAPSCREGAVREEIDC